MELTWLLCNRCYIHLAESKSPFSLTNCGHLYCRKCISKVGVQCPICKTNDVQSICLTTPLQPVISGLFEDILTMAEKLTMAAKFQKFQMKIMEQREQELAKKYLTLKSTYWQVMEKVKKDAAQFSALKADYEELIAQKHSRGPGLFKETPRPPQVSFVQQPIIFGDNRPRDHTIFRRLDPSEDSDSSNSTVRALRTPRTPDGMFRIPVSTRIPKSIGSSTASSGGFSPMRVDSVQRRTGYVSDSNGYYRR